MSEEQYAKLLDQVDSVLKEIEKELSSRSGKFLCACSEYRHTKTHTHIKHSLVYVHIVLVTLSSINVHIIYVM